MRDIDIRDHREACRRRAERNAACGTPLDEFWDQDHWPGVRWPVPSYQDDARFGHPSYRFLCLTWTEVYVTARDGRRLRGTLVQVHYGKLVVVVDYNGEGAVALPFRPDRVRPASDQPIPYSGSRGHSGFGAQETEKGESHDTGTSPRHQELFSSQPARPGKDRAKRARR